jgi:hypothetical protein
MIPAGHSVSPTNPSLVKRVLIVAPHFPPSNLAAVHRSRLFAQHLPEFGWEPIVLTVHHDHYEATLDWDLARLVPEWLRVERVGALPAEPLRYVGIGDIGLRGFVPMLRRILKLVDQQQVDFVYIPIPSFYAALLGRIVHRLRGIPYGIDYIDPWVFKWTDGWQPFSKHWISRQLADVLEPIAVKEAALITGVAEGYYDDVLDRNPHLQSQAVTAAMPYGGEVEDHRLVSQVDTRPFMIGDEPGEAPRFRFLYAGALLPLAFEPLRRVFRAIADHREAFEGVRFYFVGTGTSPNDPEGYNVRPIAEEYGLWGDVVVEHPTRISYVEVLVHLEAVDAVFILGSTEPHYTPSKVYQGVLSQKPILAVLHEASTACEVLRETGAGRVLSFAGEDDMNRIEGGFVPAYTDFRRFAERFDPAHVDLAAFDAYSARNVTRILAGALDEALRRASSERGKP